MTRSCLAFWGWALSTAACAQLLPDAVPPGTPIDRVTFKAVDFSCELSIFGKSFGPLELGEPKVVPLPRGNEYLVECLSVRIPVKLYARRNLFPVGDFRTGTLPNEVVLQPVAVLPNIVKAVAAGGVIATTVRNATPYECKRPPDPASAAAWSRDRGELVVAKNRPTIPKDMKVLLSATQPKFCADTNLVEVKSGSGSTWYRNQDFEFSYQGKTIQLYPPSRETACCWRE